MLGRQYLKMAMVKKEALYNFQRSIRLCTVITVYYNTHLFMSTSSTTAKSHEFKIMFVSFPHVFIEFHLPDTQKVLDNIFQLNK